MNGFHKWLPSKLEKYKVKDLFLGNRNFIVLEQLNNMYFCLSLPCIGK
jgi:hypothetical protein